IDGVARLLGVEAAHQDVLAQLGPRVDVRDEVVDHRVRPSLGLGPAHDADLVPADVDRQLDSGHRRHARAPQPRGLDDDWRQDIAGSRPHAADTLAVEQDPDDGAVFDDARTGRTRGAREPLRRLHGIAIAGGRLVTAGDEVVRAQPGLELTHFGRRDEPRVDADRALKRDRGLHRLWALVVRAPEVTRRTEGA